MKKKLLSFTFLLISTCMLSAAFAQDVPGGEDTGTGTGPDGGGTTTTPPPVLACPDVTFKRNNGNGTCWGYAQIRVTFPDQFATGFVAPKIIGITYQGNPIKYMLTHDFIEGVPTYTGKGYVSYCIGSTDQFPGWSKQDYNIEPANKLYVTFEYASGLKCFVAETF